MDVVTDGESEEEAAKRVFELFEDLAYRSVVQLPQNLPSYFNIKIKSATVRLLGLKCKI